MPNKTIQEIDGQLCIVDGDKRYLPGPVNPFAFHYDQRPDGLHAGDEVEAELRTVATLEYLDMTLADGSKKAWFLDGPARDDHLLQDYPRALTGGLPVVGLVRTDSLCTIGAPLLPVPEEDEVLDFEGMKTLAALQMSRYPQYEGHFDDYVPVRIRRDVSNKRGKAFLKDEMSIAKPDLEEGYAIVWSFHRRLDGQVLPRNVEFLPVPAPAMGR